MQGAFLDITLYDLHGKSIEFQRTTVNTTTEEIVIINPRSGIYLLTAKDSEGKEENIRIVIK